MTVVADVVAQLRADTTDFQSHINSAEHAVESFGNEVEAGTEKIGKLREGAQIAATAIGGTFTAAIVESINIAREYTSEIESMRVSFDALMGSTSAGDTQIKQIEEFANNMGIATNQVAGMAKELEILTQGQHDSTKEWGAFANAAAATGKTVTEVADAFGRAYSLMQTSGPTGGQYATRSLRAEGLITPDIANQAQALATSGGNINQIWDLLVSGADRFTGAGAAASQTLSGLMASFHNLLNENVGSIFMPLIQGVETFIGDLNTLMNSRGFKLLVEDLASRVDGIAAAMGRVASHITSLGSSLNASGLDDFINHLKTMEQEFIVLTGLMVEFGTEFIGHLPILNRFAEPFIQFLDNGRGGMLALLLATQQGRHAFLDLGESVLNLVKSIMETTAPLSSMLNLMTRTIADFVQWTADIVNFVAQNKLLISIIQGVVAAIVAMVIVDDVAKFFFKMAEAVGRTADAIWNWLGNWGKAGPAKTEELEITKQQTAAYEQLTQALLQVAEATTQVAVAQGILTEDQAASIMVIKAKTAAVDTETTSQIENNVVNNEARGIQLGTGTVAAGIAGIAGTGLMIAGSQIGGGAGKAMSVGGAGLTGAAIGAQIGTLVAPEVGGTAIGALIGGTVGLAAAFTQLAFASHSASQALSETKAAAQATADAFNRAHTGDMTDYNAILDKSIDSTNGLSKAQAQLAKDQAALKALGPAPMAPSPDFTTGSAVIDQVAQAQYQQAMNVYKAQRDAIKSQISSDQGDVSFFAGTAPDAVKAQQEAMANLMRVAGQTGQSMGDVAAEAKKLGISLDFDTSTRAGARSLQELLDGLKALPPAIDQANTFIAEFVKAQDNLADKETKRVDAEKRVAEQAVKNFDIQNQAIQQAQSQVKAEEALTKATDDLAKAKSTQVDAAAQAMAALDGQQLVLTNLNATVTEATQQGNPYVTMLQEQVAILQPMQDQLTALNNLYQAQQNQVTQLTDSQKKYQDILKQPLSGSNAYDVALHNNQMQQDAIQLQVDTLMGQGHYSQEPAIKALNDQLAILKNQASQIDLKKSLDIGDKQFQLQQVANTSKEVDFNTAVNAAQNVHDLGTQVDTLNQQMTNEKPVIDQLNDSYNVQKQRFDNLVQGIGAMIAAYNGVKGSQQSVTDANNALEQLARDQQRRTLQSVVDTKDALLTQIADSKTAVDAITQNINDAISNTTQTAILGVGQVATVQAAMITDMKEMTALENLLPNAPDSQKANVTAAIGAVNQNLQDIASGKTTSPYIVNVNQFTQSSGPTKGFLSMGGLADGGVLAFASGGENHTAQISNMMRLWAEPETGGEAYIPLSQSKRAGSMDILTTVANMFGFGLVPMADGGTTTYMSRGGSGMGGLVLSEGAVKVDIHDVNFADERELAQEVEDAVNRSLEQLVGTLSGRK